MSQIKSKENFVNETLIISSMWKAPCGVFHNMVSSIWILHNGEHTLHTLQERKTPCPLRCKGAHPESSMYFCGVFRSKPLDERQEWVNASGFCRTCLRPQHPAWRGYSVFLGNCQTLNDYYSLHKAFYSLRLVGKFYWYPAIFILILEKFQFNCQHFQ